MIATRVAYAVLSCSDHLEQVVITHIAVQSDHTSAVAVSVDTFFLRELVFPGACWSTDTPSPVLLRRVTHLRHTV